MRRFLVAAIVGFGLCSPASAQVVINELMYNPIGGSTNEFVELYNAGTNAVELDNWRFTDGITYFFSNPTTLPAGGYLVVAADRAAFAILYPTVTNLAAGAYSGQLNNGGEHVALADANSNVVFEVTYNNAAPWPLAAAGLGSSLILLDPYASPTNPANWGASAELNGSPGGPGAQFVHDIVINEVLTHTDPPQEDAVELYNLTTNTVNVSGWYLSDDKDMRKKYRFPTNSLVPPQGYIVVYQSQTTNGPDALIPFSFNAKGDECYLSQGNTNGDILRYVDEVAFDAAKNGISFGRYPNGTGDLIPLAVPTFGVASPSSVEEFETGKGGPNVGPYVGSVVINEIMYHPSTSIVTMAAEYVELLNRSASAVPLYNTNSPEFAWSLSGGIDFTFPTNMTMSPGQYVIVVGTNDIAGFRASYNVPTNVIVLGPWTGSLDNAGDTIRIRVPNTPEPPSNAVGRYVEDEVKYNDKLPWPLAADGLGGSLQRIDPTVYGNTPDNWHSSPNLTTAGWTNTPYVAPGSIVISEIMAVNRHTLQDEDGDYSDWLELYNTRPYSIALGGWYLTDSSSMPTQWTIPAVSIPAHGYLVVFADMKDRTNDWAHLHANFSLSENGEYLGLYRPDLVEEFSYDPYPAQYADVGYGLSSFGNVAAGPVMRGMAGRFLVPTNSAMLATNWNAKGYDDSAWPPGTNGFGYEAGGGGNPPDYEGLFVTDVRTQMLNKFSSLFIRFPVVLTNAGSWGRMDLRLKYEDGFMAWINGVPVASNAVPSSIAWNSAATSDRNETYAVQFTNYNISSYAYLLTTGTNVLAIQSLNSSVSSSDLLMVPELSLLDTGGSTTGVGQAAGYLYPSTPGGVNPTSQSAVAATPQLSNAGGMFGGSITVTATCSDVSATIRYTLDGSDPTSSSATYSSPLTFTSNTELRVRTFVAGKIPSRTIGAVYRISFLGINEFLASNATTSPDINDFSAYPDFIELFNAGTNAVNLAGYHLSDNPDQPFKWTFPGGASIPAGGCFFVWADGYDSGPGRVLYRDFWPYAGYTTKYYHCSFKLSTAGESVDFFSPGGSLIDSINFSTQVVDISYGRFPDGSTNLGFFGQPTAGATNIGPALSHNIYKAPSVKIWPTNDALIVTSAVQVTFSYATNVTEVRYTTNGAMPNTTSLLYTGAFAFASSGVVRARAYAANMHPGPIATRTFLRDARVPDLPIMSMVVEPRLFYDPVTGIFSNVLKSREVPGNFQFCTTPTNTAFQLDAGVRLFGLNTFLYAQKPFTVYVNPDYGAAAISYQLYSDKRIGSFDRFVLRNGNDDWPKAFLRDTLGQKICKGVIDNALQGYTPCAIYLNGAYYGLINIQEKMDEMFCSKNYNVDIADIDFYEMDGTATTDNWILDAGNDMAWAWLNNFLATNNLANPTNYAIVKNEVDIEDMTDYVAAQTYIYDSSWFHNRKWWRDRSAGGKWRWTIQDLDYGMTPGNVNANVLSSMASSMLVFHECLSNPEYRAYAAQRIMAHLSGSFSTNRVLPIIDSEAARIRSEIIEQCKIYGSRGGIANVTTWDTNIEGIRTYARQRPAIAMQHVANYFSTGQLARIEISTTGGAGRVLANYVALNAGTTNTLAAGIPVQFTAVPDIGQVFVRWEVTSNAPVTLIQTGSVWRYYDAVTNEMPGWNSNSYNDASWLSGPGQLGYGDGDEATTNSYGTDPNNKRLTYYYRKTINIPNPSAYTNIQLGLLRDDGVVMYVNGREVLRDNMPTGTVTITMTALTNITGALGENTYNVFTLAPTNFVAGTNLLAFEIHNVATNNADLGFDLQMIGLGLYVSTALTNGPDLVWMPQNGDVIRAVYAPAGVSLLPAIIASNTNLISNASPYYATGDIFVPSNTTLAVGAGVEILMPEYADIHVQGQLQLNGTSNAPIYIHPNTNLSAATRYYIDPMLTDTNDARRRWGGIAFETATATGKIVNVFMRGSSLTKSDPVRYIAGINSDRSDLYIDGLDIDDALLPIITWYDRSTVIRNSRIPVSFIGDAMKITGEANCLIENCDSYCPILIKDTDSIDFGAMKGAIVRNNRFHDFMGYNNDAVDLGEASTNILVESNMFYNVFDKAISIGLGSRAIFRHNIVRNCDKGAGVKDGGSYGLLEYNTYHKCTSAVEAYEKIKGRGPGTADMRNCIISESAGDPVWTDGMATINVSYCLSDTLSIAGIGNVLAQPQFLNAANMDFRLQVGSAAIDSADPADASDPDGSRADMGAIPFDWREGHVTISEIMYHPASTNLSEYVELYNPGGTNLNLSGYKFTKGFELTFPAGTILTNGSYLVVAGSTNGLTGVAPLILWTNGTLDNAGETIELHDTQSNEIDRVAYGAFDPWPSEPDGLGPSLSVINPRRDNSIPENWYASGATNGTPGRAFDNQLPGTISFSRGTNNALNVSFIALNNLLYILEYTPQLKPQDWRSIESSTRGIDGRINFGLTPEATNAMGIYRLRVETP